MSDNAFEDNNGKDGQKDPSFNRTKKADRPRETKRVAKRFSGDRFAPRGAAFRQVFSDRLGVRLSGGVAATCIKTSARLKLKAGLKHN